MKINLKEFSARKEYINGKIHETENLIIWNYNAKCQFERAWDKYTKMARGLITDKAGSIVARSFPKFFNYEETEETKIENMPKDIPMITEKLDGSLGIQYYIGNRPYIATRGSFTSEQAKWATKWIQERFTKEDFISGYTYLYEIIYPENRIVVDYGNRMELVLLSMIDIKTGKEIVITDQYKKLSVAKTYQFSSYEKLLKSLESIDRNNEGFVATYRSGLKVKFKGEEYKHFHKLLSNLSTISIWENVKEGKTIKDFIDTVPDEYLPWVTKTITDLWDNRNSMFEKAFGAYKVIKDYPDRKSQAIEIIKNHKELSSLIFIMLDDKQVGELLWKRCKPTFERPQATTPAGDG